MEPSKAEIEIQRLLEREPTLQRAADQLVEKIAANETSDRDRATFWGFLFNAGFYQELLKSMQARLNNNNRIHWGYWIETLSICGIKPGKSLIEATIKGLRRQNAVDDIWAAYAWDEYDPRFRELRSTIVQKKVEGERERKANLLEKFNFLVSQRMREQAARVLDRMIFLYPEEQNFRDLKTSFDEEWAREVIAQKFTNGSATLSDNTVAVTATQKELLNLWAKEALSLAKKKSRGQKNLDTAYDLAVFLHMIDANDSALAVASSLSAHPERPGRDWLIAELLLTLRRYVELLDYLQELEIAHSADPETTFAVSYLRAHALQALGQSAAAVEILRNIVQIRPNYRSAGHLIIEWSAGVATG